MNREKIREIFLRNGFTIKDGQSDLKPYVYAAAAELLKAALSQQQSPAAVPDGYALITPEQLEQHTTTAWECPPQSLVVLVSSLKRLHSKNAAAEQPDDYRWRAKSGLRYRDWQYGPMAKTAGGREGNPDIEIQALYLRQAAAQPDTVSVPSELLP